MPKAVDYFEELEESLRIDPHALDEACRDQPDCFYRVAKELALAVSQRDQVKKEITEIEARVAAKMRHEAEVHDEKISEAKIASMMPVNPEYKKACDEKLSLETKVGQLQALKEAFQQRGYVLRDLVQLHLATYYSDIDNVPRDAKDRLAAKATRNYDRVRR